MRRLLLITASLSILAAACLPSVAYGARPLYTGLSGVYDYSPTAYGQVRATGARYVRIGVPWESIAPKKEPAAWNPEDPADPNYDWGHVDGAVRYAVDAGLKPLLTVMTAPSWAEGCQAPQFPEAVCDPEPAAMAQFATAVARRFSGHFRGLPRVENFQGLNEPNLSLYFLPQFEGGKLVSPILYRHLINAFSAAVEKVDPANIVFAAGLGPIAVPKYTVGPLQFTREMLCMKGGDNPKPKPGDCEGGVHFDVFDIHPYTTGGPTHEGKGNNVELGDLPRLQKLLKAADRAGRIAGRYRRTPLWITEFAWDSKPPDPHGLPMDIEARWADEALFVASRAGVEHFFWYSLRDEPLAPGQPSSTTLQSGLYFRGSTVAEDRPKKVMYAFRFPFVAYPRQGGLLVWGRTPSGRRGKVTIELLEGGHWRKVSKLSADGHGMFEAVLHIGYGHDQKGAVRALVGGTSSVAFSMKPVPDFKHAPFG